MGDTPPNATPAPGDGFTPITSQEQFNALLSDRLERAKAQAVKQFADYDALKAKAAQFDQQQQAVKTTEQKHADALAAVQSEVVSLKDELAKS